MWARQSPIQSTCCSIDTIMFDSTDGTLRTGDGEEVREPGGRQAEIARRSVGPLLLQRLAAAPGDVHRHQRAGHRVESHRVDDRVERQRLAAHVDAAGGDGFDRRALEVDQAHVGTVVGLVVAGVQARPLGAEGMVLRAQRFGGGRVLDGSADLVAHEVAHQLVGIFEQTLVGKDADRGHQFAGLPALVQQLRAQLGRRVAAVHHVERHRHAGARELGRLPVGGTVGVELLQARGCDGPVARRHRVVGRALKHRELRRLARDQRDALDARRARADHRHALA
jgi:hypothetical protein